MTDAYPTQVSDQPRAASGAIYAPQAEPERIDQELPYYPASQGLALREMFRDAQITDRLFGFLQADGRRAFNDDVREALGEGASPLLSPDEANERFGVPGRLSFDQAVDPAIAGWRHGQAMRSQFRDEVVGSADLAWWQSLGASFAGSLLDPAGLPLWLIPELGAGRALRAGAAGSALARLPGVARGAITGGVEGLAGGVLYEGANLWLHHEAADDYDFGQASANVLLGGLLGAGLGGVGGWWESRGRAPRAPAAIEALDEPARMGAFVEALDAMVEDRPVDLAPVLRRRAEVRADGQVEAGRLAELDEGAPGAALEGRAASASRALPEVAVTPRGDEVPVRFRLVEAEDLVTSHDDDLYPNGEYPAELQPRRRDRAGAQARNRLLEQELNPKRLMFDVGAETGAPIVARDGVVESGNGRTIALRRSYRAGSPASRRYRAELEAQGFDVSGMTSPVLVRERTSALSGGERVRLTRDMNAEATEAYSPSERASADAGAIDDGLLQMIDGADLNAAGNRRFVRGFLDRVASDDLNRMTTADGRLSDAGLDRMHAALVMRAYGDQGLVEALFEATDSNIKAIGRALADAAPEWAAMRAAIGRGEVPAELDPTEALTAAVAFVRTVRARGGSISEAMDLIVDQLDAFSGAAMRPETEVFVRSFFRTSDDGVTLWRSPRSAKSLGDALRKLAGEVQKAQPGPNLFGETADAGTARQLLDTFADWFRREDAGGDLFDFGPDPTDAAGRNAGSPVVSSGREPGGQGAGGEAEKPRLAKGETPPPPKGDPFADPEVAALAADTDAMLAREGLDAAEVGPDPQTVADAVAAGAFCLRGGL